MTYFRNFALIGSLATFAISGAILSPAPLAAQDQNAEELTRGPLHEAFAESISYDPEPGIIVNNAPPQAIEEIPPDQRPAGDNVAWIPGYWAWDDDTNDFIWISGIWRTLPPGRQWVPGYWAAAGSDWQWTSGYWADEQTETVSYLSKPPKSIESGPNVDAPSDDYIWVSGNWIYRDDRYAWSPGYWNEAQPDWTWMPAHYQWTRRGYVFVDGYWDYNVARRGVVFAPVRFRHEVYSRPDYSYTPATVIAVNVFLNHLFVRPRGQYYFGDYYAPRYRDSGYIAAFDYHSDRHGYDPIYAHSRWEHRDDRNWDRQRRDDFNFYRDNENARPPQTYAALRARPEAERRGGRDQFDFAQPLSRLVENRDKGPRFQAVDRQQRDRMVEQSQQLRKFGADRQRLESRDAPPASKKSDKDGPVQALRENFARSPLAGKRADQLSGRDAPPARKSRDLPREGKTNPLPDVPENARRGDQPGKTKDLDPRKILPQPSARQDREVPAPDARIPERKDRPEKTVIPGADLPNVPAAPRQQRDKKDPVPQVTPPQTNRNRDAERDAPERKVPQPKPVTPAEPGTPSPQPKNERRAQPDTPRPAPAVPRQAEPKAQPAPQPKSERRNQPEAPRPAPAVPRQAEPKAQPAPQAPKRPAAPTAAPAAPKGKPQQAPQAPSGRQAGGGGGGGHGKKDKD